MVSPSHSVSAIVAIVVAIAGFTITEVSSHGAIVSPRSRNSIDYLVGINSPKSWPSDGKGANITGGKFENGQAAFWYSQGCFIGCPECDHMSGRRQVDLCGLGKQATINDPKYRSVNRNATAGSINDIYKHNPWRAPGTAPVADACGLAGGTPWGDSVSEAGVYTTTKYAHHGMNGTSLPPMDTGVTWKIGGLAEVSWQMENNHGGGYQYRLCPIEEPLTEACFQSHPLEFARDQQAIVYPDGHQLSINGTFIDEGTHPMNSTWSMIPMPPTWLGPRCLAGPNDTASTPYACQKWEAHNIDGPCMPCPGTPGSDCSRCDNGPKPAFTPPCDGCDGVNWNVHAVRDMVQVPANLKPGKYVLGWRYDCEATAQVWSSCSDVTLEA